MKAIVSVSPALNEPLLATVFPTATGNADMRTLVVQQPADLQMLRDHLQSSTEAVVVLFSRAEYAMAAWVRSGWSLDKAAEHWMDLIRTVLNIHKAQRHRMLLVDGDDWLGQPSCWPARCVAVGFSPTTFNAVKPLVDFALLTCCQYVRQYAEVDQLNILLKASAQPFTAQDLLSLDDVLHQHFVQKQLMGQMQDQLATQDLRIQQQEQQLQTAERQLKSAKQLKFDVELRSQQHISELQARLQHAQQQQILLQEENDLLLAQIHKVQEQLEIALNSAEQKVQGLHHQLTETETAFISLQKLQQATEAELAEKTQLLSSTTLNNELETYFKSLQQAEQENALLLDQLFKVQEQLEGFYLQTERFIQRPDESVVLSIQCRMDMLVALIGRAVCEPALFNSKELEDRMVLLSSPLFDPIWYQQNYLPEGSTPMDAAEHYLTIGFAEMFNPGPEFDALAYLLLHEDVASVALDPLLHFERHGRLEGRQYQPVSKGVS